MLPEFNHSLLGRNEEHRAQTIEWLAGQGVNYHDLLLRRSNDRRDTGVKRELLATLDKSKILFVVEDRSRVVEMWRSEGLVCLQCARGVLVRDFRGVRNASGLRVVRAKLLRFPAGRILSEKETRMSQPARL